MVNKSEVDDCKIVDLDEWVNRVLVSTGMERGFIQLHSLIKGVDDVNKSADVIVTFSEDIAGRIENAREHAMALVRVAGALARVGDPDRVRLIAVNAVDAAERIEDRWERARALVGVVDTLARAGMTDEALAVVERTEFPLERARALVGVASALVGMGDADRARWVAEKAASTAERIEKPRERARALGEVADALVGVGLTDKALAIVERIEDRWERAQALVGVASALIGVGDGDRARRVAEKAASTAEHIETPWKRALALLEVVDALARAGAIDEALKIVSVMNDPSSRSRAQSAVIKALARDCSTNDAADAMRVELAWVRGIAQRHDAADYCATLAAACVDSADFLADSADAEPIERDRWLGLARSALVRSWLYGTPVWDHFGILMRVAPELAIQLVDERVLAEPEGGTPPELEPDLGAEGPGGHTGSYR